MSKFALLVYDVPSATRYNPRRHLRLSCLYINLSCCMVRKDRLPHHVIQRLREAGATFHLADFDESASEGLLAFAAQGIEHDLTEARRRLRETIDRGPSSQSVEGITAYRRRMRAALTRYRNLLRDYTQVTREFGVEMSFTTAERALDAMDSLARRQAEAYVGAAATLPAGDAIRRAAEQDEVPAEILADYTQDHGDELAGMSLAETVN